MLRLYPLLCNTLIILTTSLANITIAGPSQTISIRSDDWCPFICDPASNTPGIMVEIARKAFSNPDYVIDVQVMEWSKALEETRQGHFTMVAGAYKTDAPDFVFPTEEQSFSRDCFYTQASSNWFYNGTKALENIKLATVEGYSYGDDVDTWIKANAAAISPASGEAPLQDNLTKLSTGKADVLIESSAVMQWQLMQSSSPPKIRQAGCSGRGEELFIAISPKQTDAQALAQKLSKTTADMRASGELKKLLMKYGQYDWK